MYENPYSSENISKFDYYDEEGNIIEECPQCKKNVKPELKAEVKLGTPEIKQTLINDLEKLYELFNTEGQLTPRVRDVLNHIENIVYAPEDSPHGSPCRSDTDQIHYK